MAQIAFSPTEEQRHLVKVLSSYGIRQTDIGTEVGLRSPKTLRKHFRDELEHGRIGANIKVGKTLYAMATSGKHPSVTIYWDRRARWKSKPAGETGPAATPDFVVARDKEGGMKIFLKPPQWDVFLCDQRFRVLVAGRRFGKTYLAMVELCRAASTPGHLVWYVGPTYK